MPNSKRKCTGCKERFQADGMVSLPVGYFHDIACGIQYANAKQAKARKSIDRNEKKAARAAHRADKERVKPRQQWLAQLQTLVNQYVVHVRDKDEPCCTCGKIDKTVKYDAGHYRSRGSCSELRFELTNIHKQCAINCNMYGSGKRAEYIEFIVAKYGQEHLDWLDGPHKLLKDQLPHYEDIKTEILRYRKLLRDNGLVPYK